MLETNFYELNTKQKQIFVPYVVGNQLVNFSFSNRSAGHRRRIRVWGAHESTNGLLGPHKKQSNVLLILLYTVKIY